MVAASSQSGPGPGNTAAGFSHVGTVCGAPGTNRSGRVGLCWSANLEVVDMLAEGFHIDLSPPNPREKSQGCS